MELRVLKASELLRQEAQERMRPKRTQAKKNINELCFADILNGKLHKNKI